MSWERFLLIIFGLVASRVLYELYLDRKYRWEARKKGYGLPPIEFGNLKVPYEALNSLKNNEFPEFMKLKLSKDHTILSNVLGTPFIQTKHPENMKALLATQFGEKGYDFGELREKQLGPLLGNGIFAISGKKWEHSRAILRPQFHRENVGRLGELENTVQVLIGILQDNKDHDIDIQPLFYKLALDNATEFLFGESCDTLSGGKRLNAERAARAVEFEEAFVKSQDLMMIRFVLEGLYGLVHSSVFYKSYEVSKNFAEYYVRETLQNKEKLEQSGRYYFVLELAKVTDDVEWIRDQALSLLLAGRDTTSAFLAFTVYLLARHERVWNKLREAVLEDFGTGTENINFSTLKRCDYLRHVMTEVLRLYPVVPANIRQAMVDTTLPRGGGSDGNEPILVKKGTAVQYHTYPMQRDSKYYGEDSEEFRPERWTERSKAKDPWAYIPFNGGPRICLGQQFALTEASYTILRLCQTFENIHTSDTRGEPAPMHVKFSASVGGGVPVRFS